MKTEDELVSDAHESFVACYRMLADRSPGGLVREDDGMFAFVSGLPVELFNGCVVTAPCSAVELDATLAWLTGEGVPSQVWIAEGLSSELGQVPLRHGFRVEDTRVPGMVLNPVPRIPDPPPSVTVERVDEASRPEYAAIVLQSGMGSEVAERLTSLPFAGDPDVELFLGRLEGRPVGISIAVMSPNTGGVVGVGTLPDARGRGVGTAVSWAAVAAGADRGRDPIVLQATPLGLPIYSAMGFRTVVSYVEYTRALGPAES